MQTRRTTAQDVTGSSDAAIAFDFKFDAFDVVRDGVTVLVVDEMGRQTSALPVEQMDPYAIGRGRIDAQAESDGVAQIGGGKDCCVTLARDPSRVDPIV